jgi:TPP-dependent pyruvate/acetoin dehydrogenase alpha subunit
VTSLIGKTTKELLFDKRDPLKIVRGQLKAEKDRLKKLEESVHAQIRNAVDSALNSSA